MKTIDDLSVKDYEKKAIREATKMLKERFPVKEIILFGSKARGDSDEESDIDLLLVTKASIHWKERQAIIHALFDIGMKHDVIFSILDTSESDFNKGIFTAFPIYQEIIREGVPAQ
jgi:predicted nucleotidyltransferase